ncbi:hypothetical protein KY289_036090 [Solanum tuberosum]|nr:hypothetical protein KY289_036090 [Solanum tuberosum]
MFLHLLLKSYDLFGYFAPRGLGQKIQYDLNQQVQGDTEAKFVPICVKFVLNKMLAYRDPAPFYFPKGKGIEDLPDALIALSMWLSEKE